MRRDVGGHTDGNTAGAVHQQLRDTRRQNNRLCRTTVIVRLEIDGVFANVAHHFHGQRRQTGLRVTHSCGAVVTAGAEVTLTVDKRIAHGPRLRHAHHGVVNSAVAVRVVVTHRVRNRLCGLHIAALRAVAVVEHGVENAAVHRLETITDLRQRTANNHAHGVVDIARLHLFIDVDRANLVAQYSTSEG